MIDQQQNLSSILIEIKRGEYRCEASMAMYFVQILCLQTCHILMTSSCIFCRCFGGLLFLSLTVFAFQWFFTFSLYFTRKLRALIDEAKLFEVEQEKRLNALKHKLKGIEFVPDPPTPVPIKSARFTDKNTHHHHANDFKAQRDDYYENEFAIAAQRAEQDNETEELLKEAMGYTNEVAPTIRPNHDEVLFTTRESLGLDAEPSTHTAIEPEPDSETIEEVFSPNEDDTETV